ncbi:unnamed protein product, partial [Ectocarpus fasciculatus]
ARQPRRAWSGLRGRRPGRAAFPRGRQEASRGRGKPVAVLRHGGCQGPQHDARAPGGGPRAAPHVRAHRGRPQIDPAGVHHG